MLWFSWESCDHLQKRVADGGFLSWERAVRVIMEMIEGNIRYEKGDFVLAKCQKEKPWPAVISRVCPNNIYKVSFVSHKTIAHIEQQFLQPFQESIIQKYCEELLPGNPYHVRIRKAIEHAKQAKIKMEKKIHIIRQRDQRLRIQREGNRQREEQARFSRRNQAEMGKITQHDEVLEESNKLSRKTDFAAIAKPLPFQFHYTHHLTQQHTTGTQSVSTFKKEDDLITADESKSNIVQEELNRSLQADVHQQQPNIPVQIEQQPQQDEQLIEVNPNPQPPQPIIERQQGDAEGAVVLGPINIDDLSTAASLNESHILEAIPIPQQLQQEEDEAVGNSEMSTTACLSHSHNNTSHPSEHSQEQPSPQLFPQRYLPIPPPSPNFTNPFRSFSIHDMSDGAIPLEGFHSGSYSITSWLVRKLEDQGKEHFFTPRTVMNERVIQLLRQVKEWVSGQGEVGDAERRELLGLLEGGRGLPAEAGVVQEMVEFVEEVERQRERRRICLVEYVLVRERLQYYCDLGRFIDLGGRVKHILSQLSPYR